MKTSATSDFNLPFSNFKWSYGHFADKDYYYLLLISITINFMLPNGHFVRMCNYYAVSSSTQNSHKYMFHQKCLAGFMFLTICTVAGLNSHHLSASYVDADRSSRSFARSEVCLWVCWLVGPSRLRAVLKRLNGSSLTLKWWPLFQMATLH